MPCLGPAWAPSWAGVGGEMPAPVPYMVQMQGGRGAVFTPAPLGVAHGWGGAWLRFAK